jgi:hypothetical protein
MFSVMVAMVSCSWYVKRRGSAVQIPHIFEDLHTEEINFLRTPGSAIRACVRKCLAKHCPYCHGKEIIRLPILFNVVCFLLRIMFPFYDRTFTEPSPQPRGREILLHQGS